MKEDFDSVLWQEWVNFKYRSIESAMLDYNRAIKAANPAPSPGVTITAMTSNDTDPKA